jgi:cobalt-zinc-cadmium efflux system outer membrane protein
MRIGRQFHNILLFAAMASLPHGLATAAEPEAAALPPEISQPPASTPVDLETALSWTLQGNPNLIAVRQNLGVSAEAIEVARQFPTSLNPTVSVDVRPWVYQRQPGSGIQQLEPFVSVSWAQPIELGNRREFRTQMAQASYCQTQWTILQAELMALVQTYRLHQTALYRREKWAVAQRLSEFNSRLIESLRRQAEANQVAAADVLLAEVEGQTTVEQLEVARQDYVASLADLRQQLGLPQYAATAEPVGTLRVPENRLSGDEETLIRLAQENRPEVGAAAAVASNSRAALSLARAERIPVPSVGPVYEKNEVGASFYGLVVSSPIPVLNSGTSIVRQREAEYMRDYVAWEQSRQQVAAQVKAVLAKWNQVQQAAERTRARLTPMHVQAERMQRLYDAGQADLVKLLQVRRRLIEAENAELDVLWQTTQAHADLLAMVGSTPLLGSLPDRP